VRANRPSLTARWVAARRAVLAPTRSSTPTGDLEGERALYKDVSGNVTFNFARPSGVSHRTQFIDGEVAGAIGRGVEQVVILGAGYDGRALRFGGGPTRWFEIDFPSTQADKRRRLAALGVSPVGVTYVPIDLLRSDLDAVLENAGHDATAPTLFLAEGLVPYLTLEATAAMFQANTGRTTPRSSTSSPGGGSLVPRAGTPAASTARHGCSSWRANRSDQELIPDGATVPRRRNVGRCTGARNTRTPAPTTNPMNSNT
jgi:hypothetical protein